MFARLLRLISEALTPKPLIADESTANHLKRADVNRQKESQVEVIKTTSPKSQREHPSSEPVVIDSRTGKVVEEVPDVLDSEFHSLSVERQLSSNFPHHLPGDIVKLAAQNQAFFEGLLVLQKLDLDDDLFQ